jgi:L-asparagine transporter-like permease
MYKMKNTTLSLVFYPAFLIFMITVLLSSSVVVPSLFGHSCFIKVAEAHSATMHFFWIIISIFQSGTKRNNRNNKV